MMWYIVGLFSGVISQSGVATAPYSVHNPSDATVNFTDYMISVGRLFDCSYLNDMHSLVGCLRRVSWQDIVKQRHNVHLNIFSTLKLYLSSLTI